MLRAMALQPVEDSPQIATGRGDMPVPLVLHDTRDTMLHVIHHIIPRRPAPRIRTGIGTEAETETEIGIVTAPTTARTNQRERSISTITSPRRTPNYNAMVNKAWAF